MASPNREIIVILEKNDDLAMSLNFSCVMVATSWIWTHTSLSISLLVLLAIVVLKLSAEKLFATEPKKIIEGSIGFALLELVKFGQILFITQYSATLVLMNMVTRSARAIHLYSA